MKLLLFATVLVLACSRADAAPPSLHPDLHAWWDAHHDARGRLICNRYRSVATGRLSVFIDWPAYKELREVMINPTTDPVAAHQASVRLGHWGCWQRAPGSIIDIP